jgi:hypothetical protein
VTIYTTGEVDAQALALLLKERDDLMAAMQEREAEIGILNETLESRNRNIEALHEVSAAQRKVLEQALDALTTVYGISAETPIIRGNKGDFEMNTIERARLQAAVLRKYYGVRVDESLDLVALLDEIAVQTDKHRELLRLALEAMQQLFPQNGHEGGVAVWRLGASYAVKEAISAIEEQFK